MSRQRERAASTAAHQPDKETLVRALDLCAHMDPLERVFVAALPPSGPVLHPDAEYLIRQGLVTRVGRWFAITPEGLSRIGTRPGHSWLRALACAPSRGMLAHLLREGIITNAGGFPVLTPLGAVVHAQIDEAAGYFAAHPELFEDKSGTKD